MSKSITDIFAVNGLKAKLLLALACILCYSITVRNNFALDDDFAFFENQYVQQGISGIPGILTHTYLNTGALSLDYRPIGGITFAIEHQIFGNNPHEAHAMNVILYTISVLLVLAVLTTVFSIELVPAFVIALFYAVHPAHTEVVASIKNREEILSFIFAMLTMINLHRLFEQETTGRRVLYGMLVMMFLFLSFASKLTSLPLVVVMMVSLYFKGLHEQKKTFYTMSAVIIVFAVFYVYVIASITHRPIYDLENPIVLYDDLSTKLGIAASSLWFYLHFLIVPYPFSFFYGYNTIPVIKFDEPVAVFSIMLHFALFIYGVILFFRKDKAGFFIIAYLISIGVYANLPWVYTGIVSERAMFFASLWFIAALCYILYQRVYTKDNVMLKNMVTASAAIVVICYGALDIHRSTQWHDSVTLMSSDIDHLENSTLANYFYGSTLKNFADKTADTTLHKKYLDDALKYFHNTRVISPSYPYGYFKSGIIYRYDRYNADSAYYFFKKAYTLNQTLDDVTYQYGRIEYEVGDMGVSNKVFTDLYQRLPNDTFTIFYHALLLMKTGHPDEGHQINARMFPMAANYYQPYYNEGIYYQLVNDPEHALQQYEKSITLGCYDMPMFKYMVEAYQKLGRADDANRILKMMN